MTKQPGPVRLNSGPEGQSESKESARAPGSQNSRGVKGSVATLALALVRRFLSASPSSLISSLCMFVCKPSPLLDLSPPGQSKLPVKRKGFREPTQAKASFQRQPTSLELHQSLQESKREAAHTSHPPLLRCSRDASRQGKGCLHVPPNPSTRLQGLFLSREQLPRTEARTAPF